MQKSKHHRPPLTIVGIVSNVTVLIAVWLLLFSSSRSIFPTVQQLVKSIEKMAKTKVVTDEELIGFFGQPSEVGGNFVAWIKSTGDGVTEIDTEYVIVRRVEIREGKKILFFERNGQYMMCIQMTRTYRGGLKYLYENITRAIKGRALFPLLPTVEYEQVELTLNKP